MPRVTLDPPLAPRNGHVLKVLTIDRISTKNQDPKSNADQEALVQQWVRDRYDGEIEWTRITGQGSGECIDRQQVRDAEDAVESGEYDVVVMEDLGRHLRRAHAVAFCELCEDHGTRLIAVNDGIDTFKDWRLHAFFAAIKHEQSNKDTSERIKRSLRNRFTHGEVVQTTIFGYVKPPGTKSDAQLHKDPAAEPVYDEWYRRLENGESYSQIADWLNATGVPTGPFCRSSKWDCSMVARITHNPILKGVRERNRRKSKRVNKSGKYISVKAPPEELQQRFCPNLVFIEPERYDRVIAMLKLRNGRYAAGRKSGRDVRLGRPKKRIRFPGQTIVCGVCGRQFVFGGNGQIAHLMCDGARKYACWNGASVDGVLAANVIANALFSEIDTFQGFDAAFVARVQDEAQKFDKAREVESQRLGTELATVKREIANLVAFVKEGDRSKNIRTELASLEWKQDCLVVELRNPRSEPASAIVVPDVVELKQLARESFESLARDSYEFATVMRQLIGRITVLPYQLCDGGPLVLRARFQLRLGNLLGDDRLKHVFREPLERMVCVDLFNQPQRAAHRAQLLKLRETMSEREAAKELRITVTAAQRTAALDRLMKSLGLTDPYVPVLEPSEIFGRVRRFLHPRFRFEPLSGYPIKHW